METLLQLMLIVIGFAFLIKGADYLVEGSCSVAQRLHIPDIVIGLTIVAFGTSAPELAVSVISAFKGSSEIAIGNVLGSNIANLCLVLGGAGVIFSINMSRQTVRREIPTCILTALLMLVLLLLNGSGYLVSRLEGVVLLLCMGGYLVFLIRGIERVVPVDHAHKHGMLISIVMVVGGLTALLGGGELVVRNSVKIAMKLHVSEALIGLTIIALGTSLPELVTSIVSLKKGKADIAIGNVVGSNIMNTCLVLGCAAVITPIKSAKSFLPDASVAVVASLLLLVFMYTGTRRRLNRAEAAIYVLCYFAYIGFVIYRK